MNSLLLKTVLLFSIQICLCADTNYQYYTAGGIKSELTADSSHFKLNGKEITLFSGSLHYWRCPWQYWSDRLLKMRAGGLNTVQSYVVWSLHEEKQGHLDFENGFLNLGDFLKKAKEADLFVILRIGPFIAAETEFGGYPAWISKDHSMRLRSAYKGHLNAFEPYYKKVLSIVNEHQFSKGGSVIALQFENEFGDVNNNDARDYFKFMHDLITQSGFKGLLTNCNNGHLANSAKHTLPGVLMTQNWANPKEIGGLLNELRGAQPNKPLFVSEFWSGWMDNWGGSKHNTGLSLSEFESAMDIILFKTNASINFYMYLGGTNFWFTNGGKVTTSYDYNAPLSESGDYTPKYHKAKEMFAKFVKERHLPDLHIPNPPAIVQPANYGTIKVKDYLRLDDILSNLQPIHDTQPKHMEEYGQAYGFILYRISANKFKHLKLSGGVRDRGMILIDDKQVANFEGDKEYNLNTNDGEFTGKGPSHKLDIFIENTGRDWDVNKARKGLNGDVVIDNNKVNSYQVYPLEFKESFMGKLTAAKGRALESHKGPALFRAELDIKDKPRDTFLRLDGWVKGNAFINGFNIGRYWNVGPQHTLYVPGPYLKTGKNDIYIFELESHSNEIHLVDKPDLGKA